MIFVERVTRSLRGELPASEQEEFSHQIETDPEKRKECEKLTITYDLLALCAATEAPTREIPVEVLEGVRARVKATTVKAKSKDRGKLLLLFTALVAGLLAIWILGHESNKTDRKPPQIEFAVQLRSNNREHLKQKLNNIIFPSIQFQGATIEEAVEYLRVKSRDLDNVSENGTIKGADIQFRGRAPQNASLSLDLKDIPLIEALRYVSELAQMKFIIGNDAVYMVSLNEKENQMYEQSYRVPPDPTYWGASDKTTKDILVAFGIEFPTREVTDGGGQLEHSYAYYDSINSLLTVKNNFVNLTLVEALVESLNYSISAVDILPVIGSATVSELHDTADVAKWEGHWADSAKSMFKVLIQERGTWDQGSTKFNKHDIGQIKVVGKVNGDNVQRLFTVRSADTWSSSSEASAAWLKVLNEAKEFVLNTSR